MITVEIPESKAKESAEDKLVRFVLEGLNKSEDGVFRFDYYYGGCGVGKYGRLSYYVTDIKGEASVRVISSVLEEFSKKGYLVDTCLNSCNIANVRIAK